MASPSMPLDYLIASVIRQAESEGKKVWFNRLEELLQGISTRSTISKKIDELFDYGIISGSWEKNDDGAWVRTFHISGEAQGLIDKILAEHTDNAALITVLGRLKEKN